MKPQEILDHLDRCEPWPAGAGAAELDFDRALTLCQALQQGAAA